MFTKVFMNRMPLFANTSDSLVKAAFVASGVAVIVGQIRWPMALSSSDGTSSIIGKKMMSSGFRSCFT